MAMKFEFTNGDEFKGKLINGVLEGKLEEFESEEMREGYLVNNKFLPKEDYLSETEVKSYFL